METVHQILNIQLRIGEVVVALTSHRGCLYAITNGGTVYRIDTPQ
jgi:hypothetical protein